MRAVFSGLKVLLALTVMSAVLTAVSSPAEAAGAKAKLSLSRSTVIAREKVTVTARAGHRLKRPVRLEYRDGRRWRVWRKGTTNKAGVKKFTVRTTRPSIKMRVKFPKKKVKGKRRAAKVSRSRVLRTVRQSVALQMTKDSAGRSVSAVVTARPARPGRKVALQWREPKGAWRKISVARAMDSRGRATFAAFASDRESDGREYRAHLSAHRGAPAMTSAPARVAWPLAIDLSAPQLGTGGAATRLRATTKGSVRSVRFYIDGQEVGRDGAAPWEVEWEPVRGRHDLSARAIGVDGTVLSDVAEFNQPSADSEPTTGLPPGFSIDTLQTGFDLPTAFAVSEAGPVFVSEKSGRVLRFGRSPAGKNSTPQLVADLSEHVSTDGDRGMTGLALHPRFGDGSGDHDKVYVSYVLAQDDPQEWAQAQQVQVLDVAGWEPGDPPLVHDPSHVILGRVTDETCRKASAPFPDDCVPLMGFSHTIGDLLFDHDGNLLVGVGDGTLFFAGLSGRSESTRAQDPRVLAGKVLRIDPDTGRGVEDNPYFGVEEFDDVNAPGSSNASRVMALGLRNPFRLALREDGLIMLGDVGESDWEELDAIHPDPDADVPPNYGWPCYEGTEVTSIPISTGDVPDVEANPWDVCRLLRDRGRDAVVDPVHTYPHIDGASVTGGVFYTGDAYPQDFRNSYFFGDYAQNFIRTVRVDDDGAVTAPETFAVGGNAGGPVKFVQAPDGRLWFLSIYENSIRVVDYAAPNATSSCPLGSFRRTYHDLSGSTLAGPPPADPAWWWSRLADAVFPAESVGQGECVDSIHMEATTALPHPELPSPWYGVRWQGRVSLDGGTYSFAATGMDWVRMWVGDEKVIDWQASSELTKRVRLPAGIHTVRFEVVRDEGVAHADAGWSLVGELPQVRLVGPANGMVLPTTDDDGIRTATLDYRFEATAGGDGSQIADLVSATVMADLVHVTGASQHAHPFRTEPFALSGTSGAGSGSIAVNDGHASGHSVFRLRAKVVDSSGASRISAPVYVCLEGNLVGICGSS